MDLTGVISDITRIARATGGARIVAWSTAWYWNRRKDQLERYQYLDRSYKDILKTHFEHPQFVRRAPVRNRRARPGRCQDKVNAGAS